MCCAVLHAPAAFLHFSTQSLAMVSKRTSQLPTISPHTIASVAAVVASAKYPDWQDLCNIDVLLHQHSLSHAIDEASHHTLID